MNDLDFIKQIEKELGIKLEKTYNIGWGSRGYTLNPQGQVTGVGLNTCGIDNKKLQQIISPLKELKSLTKLYLSGNQISDISPLNELKSLTILWLYNNQISDISPLKKLTGLTQLNIRVNQISDISPLKELICLMQLDLSFNKINDISFLKGLMSITELGLWDNQISDISPLKDLKNLMRLNFGYNQISDISPLKELYNKDDVKIDVSGNPLRTPPVEIVKQGKAAIQRYFEKIKKEGIDYIYEAKLILVGEGASGKTSLQYRLINPQKALPKKEARTRGIKIIDWHFKKEKSKKHIAHIWDFGGQDVYYPVHRFFLTENSVFVLLASTRISQHNFEYWIPTIFQFGGNSPVILGQTCHNGLKVPWNDIGYYLGNPDFNIIKTRAMPYYELNLPNKNEGLTEIKKTIIHQMLDLPYYGKGVPASWVLVRDELSKKAVSLPCIPFDTFRDICIKKDKQHFSKPVDINDLGKFLHSIGVILWYSNHAELKHWVILQPEWAVNAVYKIIDDGNIQKQRGNIKEGDFKRLWTENCYDDRHSIMKKMLEVFKIAFPKKDNKEEYIIPTHLLSMPAKSKWQNNESYLRLEYKYAFMPKGLVNQLSAGLSRHITQGNEVWNDAVNFNTARNTAHCQVKEDFYTRTISIRAKGQDARGLIMMVMEELNNITDDYRGVVPQIYVPCTCEKCGKSDKPTPFLYDDLLRWSAEPGRENVVCNESNKAVSIDELLFNVGLPNPGKEKREKTKKEKNKRDNIFISYSHKNKKMLELVQTNLKVLDKSGVDINVWSDKKIKPGQKWKEEIEIALASAKVAILLISTDFLASDFIMDTEVPALLKAAEKDGATILMVFLEASAYDEFDFLSQFQAVNSPSKPLAALTPNERNKVLVKLAKRIKEIFGK